MVANGDTDKKIWGTEWGAPTNGPSGSGYVTESTQAAQVMLLRVGRVVKEGSASEISGAQDMREAYLGV